MLRVFQQCYHIPGTLAANLNITQVLPTAVQLVHVSACNSVASNAILDIGYAADPDAYLADFAIGNEDSPAVADRADFVGGEFPHIAKDTAFQISLDFDGAGGTAASDFTLILTFTAG